MSATGPDSVRPLSLKREGAEQLVIEWSDGHRGIYAWKHLRDNCPCAGCREERLQPPDPFRILKPNELVPLAPAGVTPIGHYAYKITWSDGHDTGIYTLEHLRALCECDRCRREGESGGPAQQ